MKLNLNFIIGIIIFGILVYLNSKKGIFEGFFNQNRFPVSRVRALMMSNLNKINFKLEKINVDLAT